MLKIAPKDGWSLKNLIPPPLPDLREVNLAEVEVSVAALTNGLRHRVPLDRLPRELHYQICLSDDDLFAARFFIQGRTGLPASVLESASKLRLRESMILEDGVPTSSYELTVKSTKRSFGGKKRVVCSEISVQLHQDEFHEWATQREVTGRLAKLRLRHDLGVAPQINVPIIAEIDHILGAGPATPRPSPQILLADGVPSSPLAFNLVDFELAEVEHSLTVDLSAAPFNFLDGIGIDLSSKEVVELAQHFRKGSLAREGITKHTRKAEKKFLISLAA